MKFTKLMAAVLALGLCAWGTVHAEEASNGIQADGTRIVGTETTKTTDANGVVTEKRLVKKMRARTVVDFEEASIEGKVKKPNAAYLLHGADLDLKHLYRVKQNQRSRILGSYEYVR